jgi:hypothetical protein
MMVALCGTVRIAQQFDSSASTSHDDVMTNDDGRESHNESSHTPIHIHDPGLAGGKK